MLYTELLTENAIWATVISPRVEQTAFLAGIRYLYSSQFPLCTLGESPLHTQHGYFQKPDAFRYIRIRITAWTKYECCVCLDASG